MKKLFNKEKFCGFGSGLIGTFIFCELVMFVYDIFIIKDVTGISILSFVIRILFYSFIEGDFVKAKGHIAFAHFGITALLICDYVMPFIFNFGLFAQLLIGFGFVSFITLAPLVCGVVYFIGICLLNGNGSKGAIFMMLISGAVMVFCGVSTLVVNVIEFINNIQVILKAGSGVFASIMNIIYVVVFFISVACEGLFSLIFFSYPIVLKNELEY